MKTAISVPDETFDRATRRAAELGMSRSEFFSRAADRYLHELDEAAAVDQINRALDTIEPLDASEDANAVAGAYGLRQLAESDDW